MFRGWLLFRCSVTTDIEAVLALMGNDPMDE